MHQANKEITLTTTVVRREEFGGGMTAHIESHDPSSKTRRVRLCLSNSSLERGSDP
jgi:hypothetical protein